MYICSSITINSLPRNRNVIEIITFENNCIKPFVLLDLPYFYIYIILFVFSFFLHTYISCLFFFWPCFLLCCNDCGKKNILWYLKDLLPNITNIVRINVISNKFMQITLICSFFRYKMWGNSCSIPPYLESPLLVCIFRKKNHTVHAVMMIFSGELKNKCVSKE